MSDYTKTKHMKNKEIKTPLCFCLSRADAVRKSDRSEDAQVPQSDAWQGRTALRLVKQTLTNTTDHAF